MSNAAKAIVTDTLGGPPFIFELPIKASTKIWRGTLVSQHSGGYLVPYSTSGGGVAVGVAQHDFDNSAGADGAGRCRVESKRGYALANGAGGDAFAETDAIGSIVYATDDHTAAKTSSTQTRQPVGFYMGLESDGKVRVFVDPPSAKMAAALTVLTTLTDSPATADALRDNIVALIAAAVG